MYSSSIGFTEAFGDWAKQLVGLSGIFIGVGEVLGMAASVILMLINANILNTFRRVSFRHFRIEDHKMGT